MSDRLIERLVAQEPYSAAQTTAETKWQNELPGAHTIDGKSKAAGVILKTDNAPPSDAAAKPDGTTKTDAAKADTTKTNTTNPDTAVRPDTLPGIVKAPEAAPLPGAPGSAEDAASQQKAINPGDASAPNNGNSKDQLIRSSAVTTAIFGGISAAGLTRPAIEGANKLAYSLRGLTGSSQFAMTAKDAANAWIADASATKLIVSRADVMKGITTPTLPTLSQNIKSGAFNTLGVGVFLELDRVAFREPEDRSWNLSSLTVPIGMALGRNASEKLFFAGLGLLPGHAVDRIAPPPMATNSALSTFNSFDALALGAAFAIPAKSYAVKAGLVGIGWTLGNAAETVSNIYKKSSERHSTY